jgi:hypothetical protein
MEAPKNLFDQLKNREDWAEIEDELCILPGGSSGVDMPHSFGSKRLQRVLEAVPSDFPYLWEVKHDKEGRMVLTEDQQKVVDELWHIPGIPFDMGEVSSIIRRASYMMPRKEWTK